MCILGITKPKNYRDWLQAWENERLFVLSFVIMAELISKKIFDSEINTKIDTKISIEVFLLKVNYN